MNLERYFPAMALFAVTSSFSLAQSYYSVRLEDKSSVYVARGDGGAHGNGIGDDTDALQHATPVVTSKPAM